MKIHHHHHFDADSCECDRRIERLLKHQTELLHEILKATVKDPAELAAVLEKSTAKLKASAEALQNASSSAS